MRRILPPPPWTAAAAALRRACRVLVPALALLALLAPAPAALSRSAPGVPLPSNVIVDVNRTEPSVAVNPRDPRDLLVATNPNYNYSALRRYPPAFFASFDGGRSWLGGDVPMPAPFWTGADTSVAFDRSGIAYVGMVGENSQIYCTQTAGGAAILVARSTDGGRHLSTPTVVDINPPGEGDDKPYIAVWNPPAARSHTARTVLYLVWTRWLDAGGSRIMFSRSLDGGRTFSPARPLYTSPGSNMGAAPAVGPHGELYVAWAHWTSDVQRSPMRLRILVARSLDGGATFRRPVPLALSWGLPLQLPPGLVRVFSLPAIAVDPTTGAVYVAWPSVRISVPVAYAAVDVDIVLSRSADRGATWSVPIALNDSPTGDRFMPSLATLPGGVVAAIFYDRRTDHTSFDVYLAAVRAGAGRLALYPNRRLTHQSSLISDVYYIAPGSTCYAPGRFVGDYITVAADPATSTFSAVWADTQRHAIGQTDIRFSRIPLSSALAGTPRMVPLRAAFPGTP
jgi:hypothetical protein